MRVWDLCRRDQDQGGRHPSMFGQLHFDLTCRRNGTCRLLLKVEAVAPIEDNKIKKEIKHLLDSYLEANKDSWNMQSDGSYTKNQILNEKKKYIQEKIIKLYKKEEN